MVAHIRLGRLLEKSAIYVIIIVIIIIAKSTTIRLSPELSGFCPLS